MICARYQQMEQKLFTMILRPRPRSSVGRKRGSFHEGPGFKSRENLVIAHFEAGGVAQDRREKRLEDTTLLRDADGKLL